MEELQVGDKVTAIGVSNSSDEPFALLAKITAINEGPGAKGGREVLFETIPTESVPVSQGTWIPRTPRGYEKVTFMGTLLRLEPLPLSVRLITELGKE